MRNKRLFGYKRDHDYVSIYYVSIYLGDVTSPKNINKMNRH
jgi:hypothetical protein